MDADPWAVFDLLDGDFLDLSRTLLPTLLWLYGAEGACSPPPANADPPAREAA